MRNLFPYETNNTVGAMIERKCGFVVIYLYLSLSLYIYMAWNGSVSDVCAFVHK